MNMKALVHVFISWIPLAIATVGICGLIYLAVQQDYRQSLNDPQIQMAEDAAQAIASGGSVSTVVPSAAFDIGQSLAPYIIVYDESGHAVAYSGTLDGAVPVPPAGVFAYAQEHGSDRLTWEPKAGVRSAIDVERIAGGEGFVLVGRNMREVESRESALEEMVGAGMIVILLVTFIASAFVEIVLLKKRS